MKKYDEWEWFLLCDDWIWYYVLVCIIENIQDCFKCVPPLSGQGFVDFTCFLVRSTSNVLQILVKQLNGNRSIIQSIHCITIKAKSSWSEFSIQSTESMGQHKLMVMIIIAHRDWSKESPWSRIIGLIVCYGTIHNW